MGQSPVIYQVNTTITISKATKVLLLCGMMLLSVCSASLTPHMKYLHYTLTSSRFRYDRPTYWWKANHTAAEECGSLMFCSVGEKSSFFSYAVVKTSKTSVHGLVSNLSLPIVMPPKRVTPPKPMTSSWRKDSPVSPAPMNISLYFEPACSVAPMRTKLAITRKVSKLVTPTTYQYYGNSSLTCQLGCSRSLGLKIELCAIRYAGNDTKVSLLACLEYYGPTLVNAKYCTSVYNVSWKPVQRCLNRYQGQRKMVDVAGLLAPRRKNLPLFALHGKTKKRSRNTVIGKVFTGGKFVVS